MNSLRKKYLFLLILAGWLPQVVTAQVNNEYFNANQLLKRQKYEQAYDKFYTLYKQNPDTYIFFDKATACLINLKQYDKAIEITKQAIRSNQLQAEATIRLGEIYHIMEATDKAYELWNKISQDYANNQQILLKLAQTLSDRKAYKRAIKVYEQVRTQFSNSNIIASKLADTYLQAGQYEEAIREYLALVKINPERMSYVQQQLIRFQDDYVYDIAILEISDFLEKLSDDHPSYRNLQQLEIWLLVERELFKRALATAQKYESQASTANFILFNLGSNLLAEQQFKLAEQAYFYYIDNDLSPVKKRATQELAEVYIQWAKYLERYNLELSTTYSELYEKAFKTLQTLRREYPNYQRMNEVLVSLSELAVDVLHEPDKAEQYKRELQQMPNNSLAAQQHYIEGRLQLYHQEYTRARISFTRSNKQEKIGDLAEKTRYYLALTDFYAGDYEFAKIQLNALERQNTSYFANDAVQLRLWIQNGLQADSSGKLLEPFARGVESFARGKREQGFNQLKKLFQSNGYNPLVDEALLELSTYKNTENVEFVYHTLSSYLSTKPQASPLYERLLWEKARIADQLVTNTDLDIDFSLSDHSKFEALFPSEPTQQAVIPETIEQLIGIYEDILTHFPNGFYASYVRNRIQELQKIKT